MANPQPTLAGFLLFIRNVMGITMAVLPDDSPVIPMALAVAMAVVNPALRKVCVPSADAAGVALNSGGQTIYGLAVYNLAGSNLLSYAQDLDDAPVVPGSGDPGLPFFAYARKKWDINGFVSGVVQSTSDEGTSVSLVVQEAAKNFTLANLQQLKDPYGRVYLGFAQSYGPTTWGIT
jgi:hypothetical protein